jgi:hypothetical protein
MIQPGELNMAIRAITDTTEINEGQWVCGESRLEFGLCAAPRKVLRVAGARIYTVARDENDTSKFLLRKTAKFVCDTRAEGEKLAQISEEAHNEIAATVDSITNANMSRISAIPGYAH